MVRPNAPKAYSYVRFSTPEQERGDSFRRQTEAAREYADRHGLELDETLTLHDRGVSGFHGANARTGALGRFLRAVDDGEVLPDSFLLVENLDRVSRADPWEALPLFQQIINAGVVIVTLQDGKSYSREEMRSNPMRILESLFTMIRANEESATKSRRVRAAWGKKKEAAATDKRPMTERLPAWLRLSADRTSFEVDRERANVIRRIYREALAGAGQHRIAQMLNAEGVPTFGDGKRRAAFWHRSYVAKLLTNHAVIGTFTPHSQESRGGKRERTALAPIPNYFPAIIRKRDFDRLNGPRTAARSPRMSGETGRLSNVLAGLARCPECGATMTRVNKGRNNGSPRLICTAAKVGAGCTYTTVRLDAVEHAVRNAAGKLVRDMPSLSPEADARLAALEAAVEALREQAEALVDEIAKGNVSALLRARLAETEAALTAQEEELETARKAVGRGTSAAIERRGTRLLEVLDNPSSDVAAINAVLREAFSRVVIDYRTGFLEFHWHHADAPAEIIYTMEEADAA